tara:strand:+ start:179 stop:610 length:432 start_codon:yes stop_codon:yes gene_type:complete
MLISWTNYKWPNPKKGEAYLYLLHIPKGESEPILFMNPTKPNPLKKHPVGFIGAICFIYTFFLVRILPPFFGELGGVTILLFGIAFISGTIFSFFSYCVYYFKEKKWKKSVIEDWKSGLLNHPYSGKIKSFTGLEILSEEDFN